MKRVIAVAAMIGCCAFSEIGGAQSPPLPTFDYEIAQAHELKPHRRTFSIKGVHEGFNQFHLTLTVSPNGDVIDVDASGDKDIMKFWPQIEAEVRAWRFAPFEENGKAVAAEVEEYVDLVPPERLPTRHVAPPAIRPDSEIAITLQRTGCFGTCPAYKVKVGTDRIVFEGGSNVVATGRHEGAADPIAVRDLAKKFVAADFYSMDDNYRAGVTDNPTYILSISIDGKSKKVVDYVGEWVGMPAVISELEEEVDNVAGTNRWIEGGEGLAAALEKEGFRFQSYEAQVMLKEAARRGKATTVQELLNDGVSLQELPAPKPDEPYMRPRFDGVGWLNAASSHLGVLQVLMSAGASKHDQRDKDMALIGAAQSGDVAAVRALIAYGANPNADFTKESVTEDAGGMIMEGPGSGSVLIYAAESGNPDMVREILKYHPKLEARDRDGKTALFAAGDYRNSDKDGARVECVRLLVEAGANVNARDKDGNTPLHEIFLTDVEEELLKLGADVNARNNDGETPIFTNVDNDSIVLFLEHGADLTIRNNKGQTVSEAAKERGPARVEALQKALLKVTPK